MRKRLDVIFIFLMLFIYINPMSVRGESKIKLHSPVLKTLTKQEVMLVIGEIIGADFVNLEINSKEKRKLKVEKNTFYDKIDLKKGDNTVKITAFNKDKEIEQLEIKIFFTDDMKSSKNPKDYETFYFHTMLIENGDCNECHDLKASVDKYDLKKGERGLCFNCHDERLTVKYVHGPVAGGACLSCHNPHGSPNEFTSRLKGDKLCYFCHMEANIKDDHISKLKPEETKQECVSCHDVHGNDKQYFLKK